MTETNVHLSGQIKIKTDGMIYIITNIITSEGKMNGIERMKLMKEGLNDTSLIVQARIRFRIHFNPQGTCLDNREKLIGDAWDHVNLYYPDYVESLTDEDFEKIAEDFESRYCEHEIASNIWSDVIDDWAKEHGWTA